MSGSTTQHTETTGRPQPTRNTGQKIAYAFGNLGQAAFYNTMSTFFITFVTTALFIDVDKTLAKRLIAVITGLVVVIRIAEIFIDPLLGNIVDNTTTKWGRFRPWQFIGGIVPGILLIMVFTGLFGLVDVNTGVFMVLFVIVFILLDVIYSLRDISYWGMIPALSSDSHERSTYTALGSFTGSIGYNGITVVVIPIVSYFTWTLTGAKGEGQAGWTSFGIIVGLLGILTAWTVAFGTKESTNALRAKAQKNGNPLEAFKALFQNDQLLWVALSYLLYAIANALRKKRPDARIVYVKGDDFTNELIASIRENRNAEFREKYRQTDILLMDDIQFIAGKIQTQEEFFHTFNTLYESGRQIVLTSDRPPREMTQLEDRLQTRFEWGLMVDVAPPDFETRLAIIKNKAALLGVQLPDDISSFIAENLTANVRQIEGALNKLLAYRDLLGNQVDGEAVSRAVKDMLKKYNEFVPSPGLIVEYICRYYDVDEEQVRGQGRKRDLMEARQTAMYLIRRMTNLSLNDIGKEFGDRDHTTVLHSLDQVEKKMRSDPAYAEKVKEITTNINSKK